MQVKFKSINQTLNSKINLKKSPKDGFFLENYAHCQHLPCFQLVFRTFILILPFHLKGSSLNRFYFRRNIKIISFKGFILHGIQSTIKIGLKHQFMQ